MIHSVEPDPKERCLILITGGAGYIGAHVAKALYAKGCDVLVLDNLSNGHREFCKWGNFVCGDLSDNALLSSIFKNNDIRSVMHFAGFAYVGESVKNPSKYYRNNVSNTLNLLEAMHENSVNELIFSSTCATYGLPQFLPITEKHPQQP